MLAEARKKSTVDKNYAPTNQPVNLPRRRGRLTGQKIWEREPLPARSAGAGFPFLIYRLQTNY